MYKSSQKLRIPKFSDLVDEPVLMLGFGFGSGLVKQAPGTMGTLLGLILFLPILLWSETVAWITLLIGVSVGNYICDRSSDILGTHDHAGIVWDEFVGIWLVLILLPEQSLAFWVLAFFTFRLFDIWKPWPIDWVDSKVGGGVGIMLDDILAAGYAVITIWLFQIYLI